MSFPRKWESKKKEIDSRFHGNDKINFSEKVKENEKTKNK
jgi:hypothetical protein